MINIGQQYRLAAKPNESIKCSNCQHPVGTSFAKVYNGMLVIAEADASDLPARCLCGEWELVPENWWVVYVDGRYYPVPAEWLKEIV